VPVKVINQSLASIAQQDFHYVPGYLQPRTADALLNWALAEVAWRSEEIVLFGKRRPVPRLVAWHGDEGLNYRYSGGEHRANGWPSPLVDLRDRLAELLPDVPNFVLLNRYRSGRDAMGWHTDDEAMAADLIASVSLGASRRFLVRPPGAPASEMIVLEHGSLLVMNRYLPHSLPRTRRACGERVNLSFRILP